MKKLFNLIILIPSLAWSAPSITAVNGTITEGQTITVSGSGFGTQPHSKPMLYADFEGGDENPNSTLGQASAFNDINNMEYVSTTGIGNSGVLRSTSGWMSDAASVRYDFGNLGNEGKMIVGVVRKSTSTHTCTTNIKYGRLWSTPGPYPNHTTHGQAGGDPCSGELNTTEWITGSPSTLGYWDDFLAPAVDTTDWIREEWFVQIESAQNTTDGTWRLVQNGTAQHDYSDWTYTNDTVSDNLDHFRLQDDPANSPLPTDGNAFYDLIYVDTGTWARAYLSASNVLEGSERYLQPYSAWGDTSVSVVLSTGSLTGTAYVYICDNSDVCSSGFEVTIGGTSAGVPGTGGTGTSSGKRSGGWGSAGMGGGFGE